MKNLGTRLAYFIDRELGMLRREFADGVGTTEYQLSRWCNGRTAPDMESLRRMSEAFPQLNLDWLVTGQGDPTIGERSVDGARVRMIRYIANASLEDVERLERAKNVTSLSDARDAEAALRAVRAAKGDERDREQANGN